MPYSVSHTHFTTYLIMLSILLVFGIILYFAIDCAAKIKSSLSKREIMILLLAGQEDKQLFSWFGEGI